MAGNGEAEGSARTLSVNYAEAKLIDMTTIKSYSEFFGKLDSNDTVTVCGGDGTVNRFVNGTEGIEFENRIFYCPVGSGNDFARDLPEELLVNGAYEITRYIKDLPIVSAKGKDYRFVNGVGYGIDGYCCAEGDRQKAMSTKKVDYTKIAIKGLLFNFKARNATVTVDGRKYSFKKVWIAPTMNGRFYGGGMMPTPDQDRLSEDGKLSLLVFHGKGRLKTLMVFPSIFKGEHVKKGNIAKVLTGYDITVEFDRETPLQIDGETVNGVRSYRARSARNKQN
jgi:diacylglycerol kinase family enzyme